MKLASYKSTRPGWQGLANILIRYRLRGPYSHNEVVFEPSDGVDYLMPDGSTQPIDGHYWCASSVAAEKMPLWSPRRPGRVGGVRFKRVQIYNDNWDVVSYNKPALTTANWFYNHQGDLYDWQLISSFLAWFLPEKKDRYTCSECCVAPNFEDAWRFDPCSAHILIKHT